MNLIRSKSLEISMEATYRDKTTTEIVTMESRDLDKSKPDIKVTEGDTYHGNSEIEQTEVTNDNLATNMATLERYVDEVYIYPFNGHPVDMKRFIEEYEILTGAANWDDHLRNKRLPLYIGIGVEDLLLNVTEPGKCGTWENTKDFLNKYLGHPCLEFEKKRYKSRQRAEDESIYFYGFDLKDMGRNIDKSETSIINKFLGGLRLEDVRYQLEIEFSSKTLKGKQLDDYIERALEIEPTILKYVKKTGLEKDYPTSNKEANISDSPKCNQISLFLIWGEFDVDGVEIKPFTGEPLDLKRFIMDYERKTDAPNWNDDLRNKRLPLFIGEKALRSLILGNKFGKCERWENTKDFLNKCLGDPDFKFEKERYKIRQQDELEPATAYGYALKRMGRNIGKSDTSIMKKFLKGLKVDKVRHQLEIEFVNKTLANSEFEPYIRKAQVLENLFWKTEPEKDYRTVVTKAFDPYVTKKNV